MGKHHVKYINCLLLTSIMSLQVFTSCKDIKKPEQTGHTDNNTQNKSSYAFVVKIDVTDLKKSVSWYKENFALVENQKYSTSAWAQFKIPGVTNAELGLKLRSGSNSGGVNLTFVVPDLKSFRDKLISKGVHVDTVKDVGQGVLLAFLKDPDSTRIVLRQEK